eukprot:gene448-892_t
MSTSLYQDYFPKQKVCCVRDVDQAKFISTLAKHLKVQGQMEIPAWVDHVKTAKGKELAPYDPDWLYVRAASLARKVYVRKGTGVGAFQKVYGRQLDRGVKRHKADTASGKIIRFCLQQLEEMGFVATDEVNGGRYLTSEGNREFDLIAKRVADEEAEDDEEDE